MSEIPGPEVAVIARAPAQPAPRAMPTAANSSSACTTAKVALPSSSRRCFSRKPLNCSTTLEEGVIGYQVATETPPNMQPSAAAAFPSMRILPRFASMRLTE